MRQHGWEDCRVQGVSSYRDEGKEEEDCDVQNQESRADCAEDGMRRLPWKQEE